MHINKKFKLHKACAASDTSRPALQSICFDGKQLIASNGKMLVVAEVADADQDKQGLIPTSIFAIAKPLDKGMDSIHLEMDDNNIRIDLSAGVTSFGRSTEATYPSTEEFQQQAKEAIASPVFKVGIDARLLLRLAEAMGSEYVYLHFSDVTTGSQKPIAVTGDEEGVIGLIMPVKVAGGTS